MAAPSHLFTHKVVSQKTGRADKLVLLTSAAESSTVLKSRFYLDGFFIREHNGVKKWAGYCIVGSTNYYMHAEARHSWLRERRNGQDIVVFWDAGLNTRGNITQFSIDPEVPNRTATTNNIKFLTAWYIDSMASEYGIRYRQGGSPTWSYIYGDEYLLKGTETTKVFSFPKLNHNQSMEVQAFITNSEGTTYSESLTTLVLNQFVLMSYSGDGASFGLCSLTKDVEVYYDDDIVEIGTFFFLNSTLSSAAPAGGYSDGINYYSYSINSGVTAIYSCSTPPTRNSIYYISKENSEYATCALSGNSGSIYYETIGGVTTWYLNPSPMDSNYAPLGFYSYMDGANRMVLQIGSNGSQISLRNCNEIL